MRRLLTWIAISIPCLTIPILGVRFARPTPPPDACIQLLAPTTGDVLTIDANTGAAMLDPRADFPLPFTISGAQLSPNHIHTLSEFKDITTGSLMVKLALGRRSATYRRILTPTSTATNYTWSYDSQHLAFIETHDSFSPNLPVTLTIVNANDYHVERKWISMKQVSRQLLLWSPDSKLLSLFLSSPAFSATTVMLHSIITNQLVYTLLPNQLEQAAWSPDGTLLLAFTINNVVPPKRMLTVIQRNGQILNQTTLSPDINPNQGLHWSPDGKYFFIGGGIDDLPQANVFSADGWQITSTGLDGYVFWSDHPHTLFRIVVNNGTSKLIALDVATRQVVIPIAKVPSTLLSRLAPKVTLLIIMLNDMSNHMSPNLSAWKLNELVELLGNLYKRVSGVLKWSPDNQNVLITAITHTNVTLKLVTLNHRAPEIYNFHLQGEPNERIFAYWISDDNILVEHYAGSRLMIWRIDTRTMALSKFIDTIGFSVTYDNGILAINTENGLALYHSKDGTPLFSDITPASDEVLFSLAPNQRAILVYPRYSTYSAKSSLILVDKTSRYIISLTGLFTYPVWSVDSSVFTFAAMETQASGWTLKIMSRDGDLLRTFYLGDKTRNTAYQQVRWTTCE